MAGILPGAAHADRHVERHREGERPAHALAHHGLDRLALTGSDLEHQLVMHLQEHARAQVRLAESGVDPSEVHERLVAWRARFGLAIDNALNFLNNPDGIQGHNFATQIAHVEDRRVLQGRLTLVRYNNEPQFFVADASVFFGLVADVMERLGPNLEPDAIDAETMGRIRDGVALIERKTASHG